MAIYVIKAADDDSKQGVVIIKKNHLHAAVNAAAHYADTFFGVKPQRQEGDTQISYSAIKTDEKGVFNIDCTFYDKDGQAHHHSRDVRVKRANSFKGIIDLNRTHVSRV